MLKVRSPIASWIVDPGSGQHTSGKDNLVTEEINCFILQNKETLATERLNDYLRDLYFVKRSKS